MDGTDHVCSRTCDSCASTAGGRPGFPKKGFVEASASVGYQNANEGTIGSVACSQSQWCQNLLFVLRLSIDKVKAYQPSVWAAISVSTM